MLHGAATLPAFDLGKDAIVVTASSTSTGSETSAPDYMVDGTYQSWPAHGKITEQSLTPRCSATIKTLSKSDIKSAAVALAEAFEEDEMARYFTHTVDRKDCTPTDHWKLHLLIMEHIVKAHVYSGLATVIGDDYDCIALWSVIIFSKLS